MRVLGIDPGPNGWAWAVYDSESNEFVIWGDQDWMPDSDFLYQHIAIEDVAALWQRGNPLIDTVKTIGVLQARFPDALMLPRKTVVSVLTGSARSGDAECDRALRQLVPSFPKKGTRGFTGHHRAACAVAYVAVGRLQAREVAKG